MYDLKIRQEMAKELIYELGGQLEIQKLIKPISQPAISKWLRKGLPYQREQYFRLSHPYLDVWKKYPPRAGLE